MVSGANCFFVMLHHNHGITEIAQMDKRTQQALVIALVQADRRLVQYIHNANQARTNLARQTDTLGFTAGKCFCRAGKCQVIQADVNEEFQTIANLFKNFFRNLRSLTCEFEIVEEFHRMTDAHVGDSRQRRILDINVARFPTQTRPFAAGAWAIADKLG